MRFLLCVVGGFALAGLYHSQASATPAEDCKKPVYLTFDTGHMAVAPVIAEILARQKVVVTCRIPDDCIDSKRYPLFMARAVLQELIESLQSTQGVKPC